MSKTIVVIWFTWLAASRAVQEPAVKVTLTEKGARYAAEQALNVIARQMRDFIFPRQAGSVDFGVAKVRYDFNPMKVLNFQIPHIQLGLGPGAQVSATADGAGIALGGDWLYKLSFLFTGLDESGSLNLDIKDVNFSSAVKLRMANGLPRVDASNCIANVGKFHLDATSNNKATEFLYKIFTDFVSTSAKHVINSVVCKEAVSAINKNGNSMLQTMTVDIPIVKEIATLDYRMSDQPTGSKTGLQFPLKGDVKSPAASTKTSVATPQATTQPDIGGAAKTGPMVVIQFSDILLNSLAQELYQQNVLKIEITDDLFPQPLRPLMKMDCNLLEGKICAGTFLPTMQQAHRNGYLEVHVTSSVAPSFKTQSSKINGKAYLNVGFRVRDGHKLVPLFDNKVSVDMGIKAMVKGTRMLWELTHIAPAVELGQDPLQRQIKQGVDFLMGAMTQNMMLPVLNDVLKQGIQLPTLDGIHFWKPTVALDNGHIVLGLDFSYDPTQKGDEAQEELPLIVQTMLKKARGNGR